MKKSHIQYLNWLNRNHPELYAEVYAIFNPDNVLSEAVAPTTTAEEDSWWKDLTGAVTALVPVYVASEQQKQLNALNLERAKLGQPPLDASQASTISTQVGLSPQTLNTLLLTGSIVAAGLAFKTFGQSKKRS